MKKFLRKHFRYGEKGFTLIELLVVIAILGVLAAVVVPNVSRFMGQGKAEAALTELHNVQTAVTAVMAAQSPPLSSISSSWNGTTATNDMSGYPNATYLLYDATGTKYMQKRYTEYYYTCANDGTVRGWATSSATPGTDDEIGDGVGDL